ncbi:hypothetical protein SAY87_004024 [Trapa incisa]|uniref:Uncharacterized protein n=1 Tax=Trapa incisa TaxID=236973 RepID=A0AAN7PJF8_9MYRT|nr:hypothetical protein SAY87_004024 [Trapa incisa]
MAVFASTGHHRRSGAASLETTLFLLCIIALATGLASANEENARQAKCEVGGGSPGKLRSRTIRGDGGEQLKDGAVAAESGANFMGHVHGGFGEDDKKSQLLRYRVVAQAFTCAPPALAGQGRVTETTASHSVPRAINSLPSSPQTRRRNKYIKGESLPISQTPERKKETARQLVLSCFSPSISSSSSSSL